jgi:hypothetical protein
MALDRTDKGTRFTQPKFVESYCANELCRFPITLMEVEGETVGCYCRACVAMLQAVASSLWLVKCQRDNARSVAQGDGDEDCA